MAQRRMFSPQIVDSDAFLDMSSSAQALYFHLGMRADDDGFVGNPKKILRMIGGNDDDLKILLAKRFLLSFESGVVVIKHWKIHNYIQSDRYHETKYLEEKRLLIEKDNGSYTECIQNVSMLDTESKVRLGKVRLGKVTSEQNQELWESFWSSYPSKKAKEVAKISWLKLDPSDELAKKIIDDVNNRKEKDRGWLEGFIPHPSTYLNQKRWNDDISTPRNNNASKLSPEEVAEKGKYDNIKKTII